MSIKLRGRGGGGGGLYGPSPLFFKVSLLAPGAREFWSGALRHVYPEKIWVKVELGRRRREEMTSLRWIISWESCV